MPIEAVRQSYRPEKVKVLFVGESAPAGGTFFFLGDSLTRYTAEAFSNAYDVNINSTIEFLNDFKGNNFYLDDLCLTPINHMNRIDRKEMWHNSVPNLSKRLTLYKPKAIISIMIAIRSNVSEAMLLAGISGIPFYSLPFPAHGHQRRYVEMLSEVLRYLKEEKIINSTFSKCQLTTG